MRKLLPWLVIASIITIIFGTIYATGQFILRANANDPQIQMAEDAARRLDVGEASGGVIGLEVDVSTSLQPFVIIYDTNGDQVAANADYKGEKLALPKGVLDHATPQHSVTWEPKPGLRFAAVVQKTSSGYVLVGRSLREVEKRENMVLKFAAAGWLVSEGLLGAFYFLTREKRAPRRKVKKPSEPEPPAPEPEHQAEPEEPSVIENRLRFRSR